MAVTRALGDFELRPWLSPEPQVISVARLPHDLLVLATDGVWDCIGDAEAVAIAAAQPHPQQAADALLGEVLRRGARDNVSVVVVRCASGSAGAAQPA